MISYQLVVFGGEDWGSFSENDFIFWVQVVELPFDEVVVVRVFVCGDKRSSEIYTGSKFGQILNGEGREVGSPVVRVGEFGDFFGRDVHFQ